MKDETIQMSILNNMQNDIAEICFNQQIYSKIKEQLGLNEEYHKSLEKDGVGLISHNKQIYEKIREQLEKNRKNPFEKDELYRDVFGEYPSTGKTKSINGVELNIRIAHQVGKNQSDIEGFDLLYEISNLKFIAVQYKKLDKKNKLIINRKQLQKILKSCPTDCSFKGKMVDSFIKNKINLCGVYYKLINQDGNGNYLNACLIDFYSRVDIFERRLYQNEFEILFAECKIGAPLTKYEYFSRIEKLLSSNDTIIYVTQENKYLNKY